MAPRTTKKATGKGKGKAPATEAAVVAVSVHSVFSFCVRCRKRCLPEHMRHHYESFHGDVKLVGTLKCGKCCNWLESSEELDEHLARDHRGFVSLAIYGQLLVDGQILPFTEAD